MTTEEIKNILERYYNAETTPKEESLLADYFHQNNSVEEGLKEDKMYFDGLWKQQQDVPESFENSLSHNIDRWHQVEKSFVHRNKRNNVKWATGMAAVMAGLIATGSFVHYQKQEKVYHDIANMETYDDPQDAMREAERTLTDFSLALNQGLNIINHTEKNKKQ